MKKKDLTFFFFWEIMKLEPADFMTASFIEKQACYQYFQA